MILQSIKEMKARLKEKEMELQYRMKEKEDDWKERLEAQKNENQKFIQMMKIIVGAIKPDVTTNYHSLQEDQC